MHPRSPRPLSSPRLAWLLWLALLLPLAQSTVAWHGMSHGVVHQAGAPADDGTQDPQAVHPLQCSLCLVAAALGHGALPSADRAAQFTTVAHQAPSASLRSPWLPSFTPAYRSRAPPFALYG